MMISLPKVTVFFIFLFSACAVFAETASLPKKIHLKVPLQVGVSLGVAVQQVYREILKNIAVEVEFSSCVPSTCAHSVLMGEADGEIGRVAGYKLLYPELIQVEESIVNIDVAAFGFKDTISLSSWDDLKDTNYKVGHQKGYYYPAKKLANLIRPENVHMMNSVREAFAELRNNTIDIYVGSEATMLALSKKINNDIKRLCLLESINLYPYLNSKHKALAKSLAIELKGYKESGKLERILNKYRDPADVKRH